MGPINAITHFYTRYFDVFGRARRFEYAWILLLHGALVVVVSALTISLGTTGPVTETESLNGLGQLFMSLYGLICIGSAIPWVTLNIRRFHDMNYTGWMVALFAGLWVIPPIGALASIVQFFWVLFGSGTAGENNYGQDPRFSPLNVFN